MSHLGKYSVVAGIKNNKGKVVGYQLMDDKGKELILNVEDYNKLVRKFVEKVTLYTIEYRIKEVQDNKKYQTVGYLLEDSVGNKKAVSIDVARRLAKDDLILNAKYDTKSGYLRGIGINLLKLPMLDIKDINMEYTK